MPLTRVRPSTTAGSPTTLDVALRAIADPTRRSILELLSGGEQAAGEIAAHFPHISRPAVSQHLGILTEAALVRVRKDGHRRFYRSRPEGLADARVFIDDMWRDALDRLKAAAEDASRPRRSRGVTRT